ncbi:MAG TPA: GNAT family N-acetyltransferase [Polyangiaceae bacterium]|jgi:ribosomal protein S18 acetylase RimI-like enzyme
MIVIRPARPEDADQVVPLMYESSRDLLDYSFRSSNEAPTSFLVRDFMRGRGLFGYENQIVAVDGERVVGTMTVYAGRRATELSLKTMLSAFRHWSFGRFFAFVRRSLAIAPLFIPPRKDGVFLANACVASSHRGQRIFSLLLAAAASRGAARVVELDVSFANTNAQKIYEHLGFRVTGERAYHGTRALDGFRRMELTTT